MSRHSGIGRYIRGLLEHQNGQLSYVPFGSLEHPSVALSSSIFSISEQIELPLKQLSRNLAAWHSPHFNLPLATFLPSIVTIHDTALDHFPEESPSRLARIYYRAMMSLALSKAQTVIAVSQATKKSILHFYRVPEKKIHVVHSGIDPQRFGRPVEERLAREALERWGITGPYFLYVGLRRPRKNLITLLKALPLLPKDFSLVIAGPKDHRYLNLDIAARELGINHRIIETGPLERDEELAILYQKASVLIFPSLCEGFGFPLLEALAAGCPVAASDIPIFREIANDSALFFNPQNPESLAQTVRDLLDNPSLAGRLKTQGQERCRAFDWRQTTALTLRAYQSTLS